ncbi:type II toxin-antitoxin system mRNA interferase toxin, RelE/StbE family [Nostoc sp. FACHB-87]|uniref:Type II toxin-antitoxin system mRNA interferase toxin, RelE/StbE family n=1 Tax=Nostoc spongiaeforme FACHB-130 TaxID=1357510 RepID=A0ABR8G328_9NOSO|nr:MULTISPECIES: type II toxin-antitoxin system mRNA interferase toxin, RelE/StbE family [Nostocales]OCQ96895.1 plasmid stabilization protein [Nostoc sp. MBR 210]MBD2302617.1 type II toxin-antitoxin system mRNA interferase toxin, RelE/StbE family [Nostoc sp. FACHB-190]MBD2458140.1 type II toxin-antitoxin system mRNA interferase toxin, RelE/StbE family [Nostoc sp. FACHB-87]MBD2478961.1 type II toxin-antitoxin system mRNA interferase toxin, RelE/StbE family [Anabaena sp. FACHB-83]MBD2491850.1 ty
MMTLVLASSFKRAFKRLVRRQPELQERIEERLTLLASDPFDPLLQTHKLKGKLSGAWACSVDYDCRIVFNFVQNPESDQEEILLIDIGSHDEVY